MSVNQHQDTLLAEELEERIAVVCRGAVAYIDGFSYSTILKAHIYIRIAEAMMHAVHCELIDAAVLAESSADRAAPIYPPIGNSTEE